MVHTNRVVEIKHLLETLNPPAKILLLHGIPLVQRIPPKLAGFTEIIGWHASHPEAIPLFIYFEQMRISPHIGTVMIHKNRNIANHADALAIGVGLELIPLPVKLEL